MKITFLGTGNAQATACYNTCFVMEEGGKCHAKSPAKDRSDTSYTTHRDMIGKQEDVQTDTTFYLRQGNDNVVADFMAADPPFHESPMAPSLQRERREISRQHL